MGKNDYKSAAQATCPIGLIYTRSTYTGQYLYRAVFIYPGLIYPGLIYTGQYPPTNKRYATATLLLTSVIMGGSASAPVL